MGLGKIFNTKDISGLIFLRLGLGTIFFVHGTQKLFGWFDGAGLEATLAYFEQHLGIPMYPALIAIVTECVGALGVVLGLLTRVAAFGLAVIMIVAMIYVHLPHGFFLNWNLTQGVGHGIEYNLALLSMCLTLVVTGPGKLSADKWISEL